jgi:signal transduction histidine kinase
MITLSVLGPVRELILGARSVGAGNLEVQVPVTSTDDLGELAESFNEMVAGLRERMALRDANAALVEELRASQARIVAAADAARRQVERDLHDGAQQQLVLLGLKLGLARRMLDGDPSGMAALHDELRSDLDRAVKQLRDLGHGIYPVSLENDGLPEALGEAAGRAAIPTNVDCDGVSRYSRGLEAAIYFCCLEALQNAAKHAGERAQATVRLREADGMVKFEIADDGVGFELSRTRGSAGLQNMSDRIGALGGTLEIDSTPGSGTTIRGTAPIHAAV